MFMAVASRCAWLTGLLVLGLAGCSQASGSEEITGPTSLIETAPLAGQGLPTPHAPMYPTETAPGPTPAASPPAAQLPFPTLIRTLDFAVPAGNSHSAGSLAVHPTLGRLYVNTTDHGGGVTVVDLRTGDVLSVVKTGVSDSGNRALAVDTQRNRVYVRGGVTNTCLVLDAESLALVASIEAVSVFALDEPARRLYAASPNALRVLDVADYRVLRRSTVPLPRTIMAMAVDPAQGRIYLAHAWEEPGFALSVYDSQTLERVAWRPSGYPPSRDLVPDPSRNRVYVTSNVTVPVWVVDGGGQVVQQPRFGDEEQYGCLALDPAGDRLFVGLNTYRQYGIAVMDLQTGTRVGEIPLPSRPSGLAWDAVHGLLWVSLGDRVAVADPAAGRVVATYPLAIEVAELKSDSGRLYVTDSIGKLHILDAGTYQELAALPVSGEVTLDPAHNRLYAVTEGSVWYPADQGSVTVVDTAALTVTRTITPGGEVGWDPKRYRLYVGRFDNGGEVYDGATLAKLGKMPVGGRVVYNPLRDELLIVARTVYVADAQTLELTGDLLLGIVEPVGRMRPGESIAGDIQVQPDRNLIQVTLSTPPPVDAECGPVQHYFDATTLEPLPDLGGRLPLEPSCNAGRALTADAWDLVYQGSWCRHHELVSQTLAVYDTQGNLLTRREGLSTGLTNPNTCQSYICFDGGVQVLDLPTLMPVGTLPEASYTLDIAAGRLYGVTGSQVLVFAETGGRPAPPPPPTQPGPLPAKR